MERIFRFRRTQPLTLDDFIDEVLDAPKCKYCLYLADCTENMGEDVVEALGTGCTAFDFSLDDLKKKYIKEYVTSIGT